MPNDEIEIMRDAFCFLRDHNDPPANDSGRLVAFWERTAFDMGRLAEKWNGHPLAAVVLAGLFEYLGAKADAKTAAAGAGGTASTMAGALAGGPLGASSGAVAGGPAGVPSRAPANAAAGVASRVPANVPAGTTSRGLASDPAGTRVEMQISGQARAWVQTKAPTWRMGGAQG